MVYYGTVLEESDESVGHFLNYSPFELPIVQLIRQLLQHSHYILVEEAEEGKFKLDDIAENINLTEHDPSVGILNLVHPLALLL